MHYMKDVKFYFLNQDMGETLTGIENSSLLRARLFQKKLQISPIIITAAYNPRLTIQRRKLVGNFSLPKECEILNLYEYYQEIRSSDQVLYEETFNGNTFWQYKSVENTQDYRIYDENNKMIIYRKCDESGLLMYNNIFLNKKKVRRDVYDCRGFLSRTQHLDPVTDQVTFESYHRTDGSICIYKYFKFNNNSNNLETIHLLNRKGEIINAFKSETDFISYWLQEISDKNVHSFFIVDKERVFYPALQMANQSHLSIVCMIHSSHMQKDQDIMKGKLNSNYKSILEDLSHPDAVIFLTNRQKQHVEQRFGSRDNLFVIPHPTEEQAIVDFDKRVPLKAIYLARYSEEKQHESLIRVFHKVVQTHPSATLDFYGYGGEKKAILSLINELSLNENVFVNGFVDNIDSIYNTASLSILPSKVEGLSLFLLESIAHGCPIVSYNINYSPDDVIDHEINGYLVEPQNELEMATRVIELFGNPEKLKDMSQASYKKAESFNMDAISHRWSTLIDTILQKKWIDQVTMARAEKPLAIPTYDGSGQCVHPSVKFFTDQWNGYHYWMAMTPYTDTDSIVENASIVVSNDGENWLVPAGLINPIVKQPAVGYNSDPNLYFENGVLYLLNRHVNVISNKERIDVYLSKDGIHWSEPIEILETNISEERILSPCLIKIEDTYALYTIDVVPSPNLFKMRTSDSITGKWNPPQTLSDVVVPDSDIWHFEIIKYDHLYLMLLQECLIGRDGHRGQLHLGLSRDGTRWNISETFFWRMCHDTWDKNIYKASFQPSLNGSNDFDIWFSANDGNGQWHIGKSMMKFNKDSLITEIRNTLYCDNLFLDTFHRPDGPLGNGWTTKGNIEIIQNKVRSTNAGNNKAIIDIGVGDYEVTTCFDHYISGEHYLLVRASDTNNFIRCGRTEYGYFIAQNVKDGSTDSPFIKCVFLPSNGDYFSIRCSGNEVSIYINSVLLIKGISDFNKDATCIGMQCPNPENFFGPISVKAL